MNMNCIEVSFHKIAEQYSRYLYWKRSGMLSGKYGNKEAQRRLTKIRQDLDLIGKEMKDLLIFCMDDVKKYAGK